jgi:hypothetical protein
VLSLFVHIQQYLYIQSCLFAAVTFASLATAYASHVLVVLKCERFALEQQHKSAGIMNIQMEACCRSNCRSSKRSAEARMHCSYSYCFWRLELTYHMQWITADTTCVTAVSMCFACNSH